MSFLLDGAYGRGRGPRYLFESHTATLQQQENLALTFRQCRKQLGHGRRSRVREGSCGLRQRFDLDFTGSKPVAPAPRIQACVPRDGIEPGFGGRFRAVGVPRPVYAQPDLLQDVIDVFTAVSLAETESQ